MRIILRVQDINNFDIKITSMTATTFFIVQCFSKNCCFDFPQLGGFTSNNMFHRCSNSFSLFGVRFGGLCINLQYLKLLQCLAFNLIPQRKTTSRLYYPSLLIIFALLFSYSPPLSLLPSPSFVSLQMVFPPRYHQASRVVWLSQIIGPLLNQWSLHYFFIHAIQHHLQRIFHVL